VNIWSKHELEEKRRRERAEDELRRWRAGDWRLGSASEDRYAGRRPGAGGEAIDRTDNQGRRFNTLSMALRIARPDWSADVVRVEAFRQLKLEDPSIGPRRW
jgi:hypothetical protein